jgi:hypothetical protein
MKTARHVAKDHFAPQIEALYKLPFPPKKG